jgi:hypothetical protein
VWQRAAQPASATTVAGPSRHGGCRLELEPQPHCSACPVSVWSHTHRPRHATPRPRPTTNHKETPKIHKFQRDITANLHGKPQWWALFTLLCMHPAMIYEAYD